MSAEFWEQSYRQEHRTRHAMEDEIASLRGRVAELEAALRIATHAFAQYAEENNHPSEAAVEGFMEGFLQEARRRAALAGDRGGG